MLEFNGDEGIKTYLYFSCDKNTLVSKRFLYTEDNTHVLEYTQKESFIWSSLMQS